MKKKKNSFFTFIFSFLPGAGEMYMGFMKRGLSLMILFWGVIGLATTTRIDALLFLIPIIMLYSFFDVHNLNTLTDEALFNIEDTYIMDINHLQNIESLSATKNKLFAFGLILIGGIILWNTIVDGLRYIIGYNSVIYRFINMTPQLIISIILVVIGIKLIIGKREKMNSEQNEESR